MTKDYEYMRYLYEYRGWELSRIAKCKKVSERALKKRALKEEWKRRSSLDRLIAISDSLEKSIEQCLSGQVEVKSYKDITVAIKDALAIRRDLFDLPSSREEAELQLAREKLSLEKSKIGLSSCREDGDRKSISVEFSKPEYCD